MNEKTAQDKVYTAVAERGYREGWSAEQFLARQLCKMVEEINEAQESVYHTDPTYDTRIHLDRTKEDRLMWAARYAKVKFDNKEHPGWYGIGIEDPQALIDELADMQVVLFCAAAAAAELTGQPVDIVQLAVDKATADIARGVRNG